MAGIGFELKKLYEKRGVFYGIRALFYSSFVLVGPQLMILLIVLCFRLILASLRLSYVSYNLFMASTLYPLLFSQIVTAGFSLPLTRYAADCLYSSRPGRILPSLYGAIALCLPAGAVTGGVFLLLSPLSPDVKAAVYLIFLFSILLWLLMVYLSTLRNYVRIALSFLAGMIFSVAAGLLLVRFGPLGPVTALLLALAAGLLLIDALLLAVIRGFLARSGAGAEEPGRFGGAFDFLRALRGYPALFFVGLFYTLSLYGHNFVFWAGDQREIVAGVYATAPVYDIPTFFAFLTILPACVLFPVHLETAFYDRYRRYYGQITRGGNLGEITRARTAMTTVLWQELEHVMELQLFCTVLCILLGGYFLPLFGLTKGMIDTFAALSLGAFCSISMYMTVLLDLYFENRAGALTAAALFLVLSTALTAVSQVLGSSFYGTGYLAAAFAALLFALADLSRFLRRIDFVTFCSQPLAARQKKRGGGSAL